ncbi:PLP-dependent aminotransferase family protein [Leucobacter rhizosphaerae]|uniref:PLP-dependent aminotransferase family protein n=1 Tax=Leucobacter rhizosphaerae TaxID=2932245 RepID=A0ABY4FWD5_9MICO|nr:PLP-dependent aminotransferase family protein [Leucobacter rhizosphaerae]UOQ60598.1 PLP-dependent aminotransferase family protein [Leucobacter rhizosphaerae]
MTRRVGETPAGGAVSSIPVHLDRDADAPLPVQLAAALREAIDAATLRPGEGVPATRAFARRLGVARGVVVAAYEQLVAEGYLTATHGQGTRVNPALEAVQVGSAEPRDRVSRRDPVETPEPTVLRDPALLTDRSDPAPTTRPLAPGRPITDAVDSAAWRSAWRAAAARAHLTAPELGHPRLRTEIADHLRRMRGTARPAHDVLVTAGTRDGLGLLLTALGTTRGHGLVVGVEDPGLPSLRAVAARYGARIVALPADAEGLDTTRLPEGVLDVVIVTPSHQYPLGGSLPLTRRRELLAWASRAGVLVVEDDFDSELRYTGSPLPTLAALDDPVSGVVVLLGTFSRTIAPGLSAGYLLAPEGLRSRIEPIRRELGGPVSTIVQEALAQYLASGELRRHTSRMLRRYAARRDQVSDRLAGAAGVRVRPMDGGLHAVIEFTGADRGAQRAREAAVVARADAAGLGAEALSRYWQQRESDAGIAGLVIGMGGADDAEFGTALTELRALLA